MFKSPRQDDDLKSRYSSESPHASPPSRHSSTGGAPPTAVTSGGKSGKRATLNAAVLPPLHRISPRAAPISVLARDSLLSSVLNQFVGDHNVPMVGMIEQRAQLQTALQETVKASSSNSMLIVGKRGSGKSHLLRQVLSSFPSDTFQVITLNGVTHPDDESALQDCIRQLAEAGNDPLLEQLHAVAKGKGSFSDHLKFLLDFLRESKERRRLVLVLEEFDAFTSSTRQKLLYNLLDLTHVSNAGLALVGMTERVDVLSLLEKRVRSRFEHRQIHLPSPPPFETLLDICQVQYINISLLPLINKKNLYADAAHCKKPKRVECACKKTV